MKAKHNIWRHFVWDAWKESHPIASFAAGRFHQQDLIDKLLQFVLNDTDLFTSPSNWPPVFVSLWRRFCSTKWNGSSLVLGTMYAYDIFAAMPCCPDRLTVSIHIIRVLLLLISNKLFASCNFSLTSKHPFLTKPKKKKYFMCKTNKTNKKKMPNISYLNLNAWICTNFQCNSCFKLLLYPHQRLNFFSDYSHVVSCIHCTAQDTHFVKPLSYCYTKQTSQAFNQWP